MFLMFYLKHIYFIIFGLVLGFVRLVKCMFFLSLIMPNVSTVVLYIIILLLLLSVDVDIKSISSSPKL